MELAQQVWDQIGAGDYALAMDLLEPGLRVEQGPGAGPWRVQNSREELAELLGKFAEIFGGTFRQSGTCLYADDRCTVIMVHETGTHSRSGDVFDNMAIYVNRFGPSGLVDRQWTVDLDSEAVESFWERNPVTD
jgi:hypothetical protein